VRQAAEYRGFLHVVEICASHKGYRLGKAIILKKPRNSPLHLRIVFTVTPFPDTGLREVASAKFKKPHLPGISLLRRAVTPVPGPGRAHLRLGAIMRPKAT